MSITKVARFSDDDAYEMFKEMRWGENGGHSVCQTCEHKECWSFKTRKIFKCKACNKQFFINSGTVFANHELPIRDYLLAIAIFVNAHKGVPALQFSSDLDVQYKTAFVLAHKIRESLGEDIQKRLLKGEVEVDGAYFCGYIKPANREKDRMDRRLANNQKGKRRCVFIIRERDGQNVPVIIRSENTCDVKAAMLRNICRSATV